jgi:hypothetical protein
MKVELDAKIVLREGFPSGKDEFFDPLYMMRDKKTKERVYYVLDFGCKNIKRVILFANGYPYSIKFNAPEFLSGALSSHLVSHLQSQI